MLVKGDLLQAIASKNIGISATKIEKQAIASLVARLEGYNPNPNPLEVPHLLDGNWRLLYTTSRELLGLNNIPLAKLGNIYQCVRIKNAKIYNIAELSGLPYLAAILSVCARFEPQNSQRVNVKFERAISGFQNILGYQSPEQFIDRIESGKNYRFGAIDFLIPDGNQQGWLDITYLDDNLRIGRGNEGSIFILDKVS
ncbi:PAP/fibrillin family protein [Oscillatoriales cyanobacterium LEGE 11467]|uniref:PAP/fibrillin family protein n=1 Tax=Zarconia navalis LEGE 11467 TaxID=1828826 RepID=A0A928VV46_9CYAN|nr:PAP/fibrillin family protein [Zarconia navalis]MBE9039272.1 PAP/fibrillin family protein [Zarconia navalis LEGE 11467]